MEENLEKIDKYKQTTATDKIFSLRKRFRAIKGGTSASKTISILTWIIDYCQVKTEIPEICTVASESFPHLNLGAIRDFKDIMKDKGYWKDNLWNATKSFYTFETGHVVEFLSVDTYGKAHGPRRDVLFLNECNNLPWIIVDQLIIRTRKFVFMDWNPTEDFWFHEQILPYRSEEVDYLTLNYKDNEALDDITIKEIESHKHDKNWWNVYGLGLDGEIQTRIYTGWKIIDEIPEGAKLKVRGLDFGYTNDPSALVEVWELNGEYILDEILFEKGLTNDQLAKVLGKGVITVADSAEPKSINEIAQYGVNIIGSKKGKGSISHGIDSVRSKKISVTKRSINLIKEYRNYIWLKDDSGRILNEPRDLFNHTMDAIRYAIAFLNPVVEKTEVFEQPVYESPTIGKTAIQSPIVTLGNVPSKNRLQFLQERKKNKVSYQTDIPWERPGIAK